MIVSEMEWVLFAASEFHVKNWMYVVANGAFSMDAKNVELTETKMRVREL